MTACGLLWMLMLQAAAPDLEQGLAALERGDLEGARAALIRAVDQAPSSRAWKALGVVFATVEDYQRAEPAFGEACRLDSRERDACYYWARALYALNRFELSLAALERIRGEQARPWRFALGRAEALSALGREAEADKAYRDALRMRRDDPAPPHVIDPTLSYAQHLYRQGRIDDVLKSLDAAGRAYGKVPLWHYQRGRGLLQLGQTEEAIVELKAAVALQPAYPEAHTLLSKAYYRLGQAQMGAEHARLAGQGSSTER